MNHAAVEIACDPAEEIKTRYELLKKEQPEIRARNSAEELGISEGELLASRVGDNATRLIDDPEAILAVLEPLGEVMALTRNENCVHERKGEYLGAKFFGKNKVRHGLFVNPDIDLRLFMNHWKFCFAAIEQTRGGPRKSLQFFDKSGTAIHKIYLTSKSKEEAYDDLVDTFKASDQPTYIETEQYEPKSPDKADYEIDTLRFQKAWENLKDTHDFFPMLKKFKIGREQSFRLIGKDFAYQVGSHAIRQVLEGARDKECEIMVFVGNRGAIQIHTGPVKKLVEHGTWYNVLDPKFNLHINETKIASTWVTKKPTDDGIITALELFDADGEIIATLFGKRKPGIPELELWREIISEVPPLEVHDA
jgi:putative hemin transport protein